MSMKTVRLDELCTTFKSNILVNKIEKGTGEYPLYGAKGVVTGLNSYQQAKPFISVIKWGAGVGRAELRPAYSSIVATMLGVLPNDDVDIHWLCYLLQSMHLEQYATNAVVPNLYFKDYCNSYISVPDLDEQERISNLLDRAQQIIDHRKQQLSILDDLIKARFVEMFGDPLSGTDKWPIHTVGDVAESIDPQPSHRTPPVDEAGIPYVSIKDCDYKTGIIDFENARKVGRNVLEEHLQRYEVHDGDFIIGKIGTIGNPIFVPARKDYTLSANIVLIQPDKKKVSPYFLKYSFMSAYMDRQFEEAKNSTSQAAFGIQKVRAIKVMNPSIDIQYQFEAFAKQVDKSKVVVQKALDEAQLLFDSLMQKYFG